MKWKDWQKWFDIFCDEDIRTLNEWQQGIQKPEEGEREKERMRDKDQESRQADKSARDEWPCVKCPFKIRRLQNNPSVCSNTLHGRFSLAKLSEQVVETFTASSWRSKNHKLRSWSLRVALLSFLAAASKWALESFTPTNQTRWGRGREP